MRIPTCRPAITMLWLAIVAAAPFCSGQAIAAELAEADVCVYGGSSGGVAAAVQVARMGKRAVIVEPGRHLGGMTSGGLSAVDIGDPRAVGGIAREYFTRLVAHYGKTLAWDKPFTNKGGGPATGGAFSIEPHVAERLFDEMVREAKVPVHFNARLARVKKEGARITELVTEDGSTVRAKMFIDATYEGDLVAAAGVSYTLEREGNVKYGEMCNGIHYAPNFLPHTGYAQPGASGRLPGGQGVWDRDFPLDPYVVPGDPTSGLLPLIDAGDPGTVGEPAPGIQAYCFRLCLTTAEDRLPIEPPPNYDPRQYEIVARFIAACLVNGDDMDLRWFSKHDPLPNDKWDFNTATFGANRPGASWEWPKASYARRQQIAKEHEHYHRGLLHFLATDPRVPVKVRDQMRRFGLPRDEFTDNGGWPHQIYVREARRMVSDFVMAEHHTFGREVAPNSIGLGSYGTDTHEIRRIVREGVVTREGKTAGGRGGAPPYPIGYGAIVPKASECENLFVTFALSASHTAFSSIRMEPVFMITSQSAATAACVAIDENLPVQEVDRSLKVDSAKLHTRLLQDGQILSWEHPKRAAKTSAKPGVSGSFEVRVPAPGPDAHADTVLQDAIDKVAEAGGGVVLLGAGDFKLPRHADDETIVLRSGVTLRGQGYATHIYLDPTTPPNGTRYYPVRIGTERTPASNVVVEHLRYTGNNARIGGGSIMGFNARLGAPEARLLSSDNVTVRHCWIFDAQQAAGCIKENPWEYPRADRQATQSRNWQVYHNYMDTCGNKMVEFAEVNGGLIADNYITNAYQGPQVIFGSRNVVIRDNQVFYTDTGINVTEGSNHIRVSGNHAEPMATIGKSTVGIGLIFRTEPAPLHSTISDIVIAGNIFRNQTTTARCTVRFQTRKEALSCGYEGLVFTGNVFDGDVQFLDRTTPGRTTLKDIVFADNVCEGDLLSVPRSAMQSQNVMVRGNMFRHAGTTTLNASGWVWSDNTHAAGTLEIADGAAGNIVRDNATAAPIVDHGSATILSGNVTRDSLP
ncbi:MAG TPA: FAD-dependent oxidoreductase [Pirellulales bacterium]|nr:FAD-dependent oxidoreductase [Pirellulales bacterium]